MDLLSFSGFLGSGKTTLILALARELASRRRRTAFVVNEIGEVGVDRQIMGDDGLEVHEIVAGCICCQLGADLVRTLEQLAATQHPQTVIVEASGVATPEGILDALSYYKGPLLSPVRSFGVVDPTRLDALLQVMTPLVESQVAGVDEIVVSKADLATPDELALARQTAARLNPSAAVHVVSALDPAAMTRLVGVLLDGATRAEPAPTDGPSG